MNSDTNANKTTDRFCGQCGLGLIASGKKFSTLTGEPLLDICQSGKCGHYGISHSSVVRFKVDSGATYIVCNNCDPEAKS